MLYYAVVTGLGYYILHLKKQNLNFGLLVLFPPIVMVIVLCLRNKSGEKEEIEEPNTAKV